MAETGNTVESAAVLETWMQLRVSPAASSLAGKKTPTCATLSSRTVIGPKKAFELGEGRHGSYTANITNDCNVPVEIFVVSLDGAETYLATIQPAENKKIDVSANTKAIFKNNSSEQALLKLKLHGNTGNLSMGGPNY